MFLLNLLLTNTASNFKHKQVITDALRHKEMTERRALSPATRRMQSSVYRVLDLIKRKHGKPVPRRLWNEILEEAFQT